MIELFAVLLIVGLILLGAEIFVPGGVLGVFGGLCLLGAMATAFAAFGAAAGGYIAFGILLLAGAAIAAWIRFFPRSPVGRRMTVERSLSDSKATDIRLSDLVGKSGVAATDLRPGGFATIDGHRVDVITQGEMIARGQPLSVLDVEGNRVVVATATPTATEG
jgi:membrane-bound serine protease (ClpP class)